MATTNETLNSLRKRKWKKSLKLTVGLFPFLFLWKGDDGSIQTTHFWNPLTVTLTKLNAKNLEKSKKSRFFMPSRSQNLFSSRSVETFSKANNRKWEWQHSFPFCVNSDDAIDDFQTTKKVDQTQLFGILKIGNSFCFLRMLKIETTLKQLANALAEDSSFQILSPKKTKHWDFRSDFSGQDVLEFRNKNGKKRSWTSFLGPSKMF